MKREQYTYLLARLPIAMSFFGHGLIRMTKLSAFSNGMVAQFSKSLIPAWLVTPFSQVLPFMELVIGFLLLLGLFTRFALVAGVFVILALIFGSCMLEQWENVFTQIIYGAYFTVIFYYLPYNQISADGWRVVKSKHL